MIYLSASIQLIYNVLFPLYENLQTASATTRFRFQTTATALNRVCTVE